MERRKRNRGRCAEKILTTYESRPVSPVSERRREGYMSSDKAIRRIAIVGTGVIGASWAAEFLARGLDVIATDPAPNAEANMRKYINEAWPAPTPMGLS